MGIPGAVQTKGLAVPTPSRAQITGGRKAVATTVRSHRRASHVAQRAVSEDVNANGSMSESDPEHMDFDELTDIIRMVNDSDIVELELKNKRFNLVVRKKEALGDEAAAAMQGIQPLAMVTAQAPPASPLPAVPPPAPIVPPPSEAVEEASDVGASDGGLEVTSPMAGTLYRSPAPGEPAFVKEGDKVQKGQTICIIEAMKLMNEIEAETSGEVVKFLANNSSPVVAGQPLLLLK